MPYRRSAYYTRGSGVAVEAACGGIPMIVTADTWLENFVEQQGAGLAVPDGDAAALAGAMADVARDFPAIRVRAVERAGIALRINSAEAFARALWRPLA
jgi:glycosyltransferase involved in cell wall biosynthesis